MVGSTDRKDIRMPLDPRRAAALALGGAAVLSALAGCSAPTTATDTDAATKSEEPYADGEYSATGEYLSPAGTESVDVELTLEGDVVTAVIVTGNATDGNAVRYQSMFADGIADEVVGRDIDDLAVDKVAGSSLTSDGFNAALERIKEQAVA